ncbi:hypothetical protein K502DRAFT_341958 [Neoconidiobolus thromboides FSU 785]|nr:hypothetical protein K502DRAFT_341958 [Neoconidiobolus thromboides FSU 785]
MSVCHLNNKSISIWNSTLNLALVIKKKGNYMTGMGFYKKQQYYLYPEEVLFLCDRGAMLVFKNIKEWDGLIDKEIIMRINEEEIKEMELKDVYVTILNEGLELHIYQVYSHLKRLGYILIRSDHTNKINILKNSIDREEKLTVIKNQLIPASKLIGFDRIYNNLKLNNTIDITPNYKLTNFNHLPQYQLWQPNHQFKSKNPGECYKYLIIVRIEDNTFNLSNISLLNEQFNSIPVLIAIVDQTNITFLELDSNNNTYQKILDIKNYLE